MTTRTVSVLITGDAKGLDAALAGSAAEADESAATLGDSFDGASTEAGGAFEKIGQKLEALGIPGAAAGGSSIPSGGGGAGLAAGGRGAVIENMNFNTQADAHQIATEVGYALKIAGA